MKAQQKKKEKDWRKFLDFMRKNPETMMSLMDNPVPSICDAKSSLGANTTQVGETLFEQFNRNSFLTPNLYEPTSFQERYSRMRPMSGKVIGRMMPMTVDVDNN